MQRAKIISLALVVGFNLSRGLAQDAPTPNPRQTQEMLRETVNRAKADEAAKKANAQKAAKAAKQANSEAKEAQKIETAKKEKAEKFTRAAAKKNVVAIKTASENYAKSSGSTAADVEITTKAAKEAEALARFAKIDAYEAAWKSKTATEAAWKAQAQADVADKDALESQSYTKLALDAARKKDPGILAGVNPPGPSAPLAALPANPPAAPPATAPAASASAPQPAALLPTESSAPPIMDRKAGAKLIAQEEKLARAQEDALAKEQVKKAKAEEKLRKEMAKQEEARIKAEAKQQKALAKLQPAQKPIQPPLGAPDALAPDMGAETVVATAANAAPSVTIIAASPTPPPPAAMTPEMESKAREMLNRTVTPAHPIQTVTPSKTTPTPAPPAPAPAVLPLTPAPAAALATAAPAHSGSTLTPEMERKARELLERKIAESKPGGAASSFAHQPSPTPLSPTKGNQASRMMTDQTATLEFTERTGINMTHPTLHFMPAEAIWGWVGFEKMADKKGADDFLLALNQLAGQADFNPGFYGDFTMSSPTVFAGHLAKPTNLATLDFVRQTTASRAQLEALLSQFRSHPDYKLTIHFWTTGGSF